MNLHKIKSNIEDFFNGKYEFVDFLGSGAFADVYIVRHNFLDDLRVMKVIKENLSSTSKIDTILQEVKLISPLNHENIITIHDAGIFKIDGFNYIYFIMEHVPGGDLNEYFNSFINSNVLIPVFWTLNLIKQITFGLEMLHSYSTPIIHGDLNPKNILLGFNSQDRVVVKLIDFGFSKKLMHENEKFNIAGTRPFMAPECFNKEFYPSTDIYSVGVIFYIFLTNHYPYDLIDFNFKDIMDGKPWNQELIPPSKYNENVSSKLDEIVVKCLDVDHNQRYQNASELNGEIENLLKSYSAGEKEIDMNNSIKKALRLAKYENKKSEAIEILEDYDLSFLLSDNDSEVKDTTVNLENISDLIDLDKKNSI